MSFETQLAHLEKEEGLNNFEAVLQPRELDEVPLASRLHRLDFLGNLSAERKTAILVRHAARLLDRLFKASASSGRQCALLVSLYGWDDFDEQSEDPLIPNIWVSTDPARDLVTFRLVPGTSAESDRVRGWLGEENLLEGHSVLEAEVRPADESLVRVYIACSKDPVLPYLLRA